MLWGVAGRIGVGLRQSGGGTGQFRANITVKFERPLSFRLRVAPGHLEGGRDRVCGWKVAAEHTVGVLDHQLRTVCSPLPPTTTTTSDPGPHH